MRKMGSRVVAPSCVNRDTMPDPCAIFIDGAYLEPVLTDEFYRPRISFQALSDRLAWGMEILRTYYYHCPSYQSTPPPTEEESQRFSNQRRFFEYLENLPRYLVRLGRLEIRGTNPDGSVRYQQKRVDIQMGVDITHLSSKGYIRQAILVTGDSDLIPAVTVAKSEGVVVTLFYGDNCHSDLLREVDERFRIDHALIGGVARPLGS